LPITRPGDEYLIFGVRHSREKLPCINYQIQIKFDLDLLLRKQQTPTGITFEQ
jgi:hypothetical protein